MADPRNPAGRAIFLRAGPDSLFIKWRIGLLSAIALLLAACGGGGGGSGNGGPPPAGPEPPAEIQLYYYVSDGSGDDGNPGTLASPMQTVQAAIDAAAATGELAWVLVESATYDATHETGNSVTLADGVSLFGGYCVGFASRDLEACPSNMFDESAAGTAADRARALTAGVGVTALTVVDGMGVFGKGGGIAASILIEGGTVTIQNSLISTTNAGTLNVATTSYGLRIEGGAPSIVNNQINGGTGSDYAFGVYAINAASPLIQVNRINTQIWVGGGDYSIGVVAAGTGGTPHLLGNTIRGGMATVSVRGVQVNPGSEAVVEDNDISAGSIVPGAAGATSTYGVQVNATTLPLIAGNRIAGGRAESGIADSSGGDYSHGIYFNTAAAPMPWTTYNEIDGGEGATISFGVRIVQGAPYLLYNTVNGGTGPEARGISNEFGTPGIGYNTIYGSSLSLVSATSYGIYNKGNSVISNNFVHGGLGEATYGVYLSGSAPQISGNTIDAGIDTGLTSLGYGDNYGIYALTSDAALSGNTIHGRGGDAVYLTGGSNPAISGGRMLGKTCIHEADESSDPASVDGVEIACTPVEYHDYDLGWDFGDSFCGSGDNFTNTAAEGNNFCLVVGGLVYGVVTPKATNITSGSTYFP